MKYLIIAVSAFFIYGFSIGQNAIEKNFKTYQEQDNFTKISVKGKMFRLTSHIEADAKDKEMKEALDFISTITAFNAIYGTEMTDVKTDFQAAIKKVAPDYEELMSIQDKEGRFTLFIDEADGIVKEVVLVGMKDKKLLIFSLEGNMELKKIGKLSQIIRNDEFKEMGKMFNHKVEEVKVFPNPASTNDQLTVEVPEEMSGASVRLVSMSGALVKTTTIDGKKQTIETTGLASGIYILEIKKDELSVKKKVIIQ